MKKQLGMLMAFAMMAEASMNNFQDNNLYPRQNKSATKKKDKPLTKGCSKFNIGKYTVIAINRKNAIRKALKLRASDFSCV